MNSTNPTTPAIVGAIAILTIISSAGYIALSSGKTTATYRTPATVVKKAEDDSAATTTTSTTATDAQTDSLSANNGYKDGSYSATASYTVPHGYSNDITVNLTIKNGSVSAVNVNDTYTDHESGMYVDAFESAIQSAVVGKSLESAQSLSRVGGASLTTFGFDDAVQQIIRDAKA